MSAPSPHWKTPLLVGALARASWGDELSAEVPGVRTVLHALVALLPHTSAEGTITAAQVADAAGLSIRWARTCLRTLEALEVITYRRGWIDRGRPKPGHVRISKQRLVELLHAARGDGRAAEVLRKRREATAQRIAALRQKTQRGRRSRFPLSVHRELSSSPPPYREVPARQDRPPAVSCAVCGHLRGPHGVNIALGRVKEHPWTT